MSELSTMTNLSWVALHGVAHSFIEIDKVAIHVNSLISFFYDCGFHSVCPLVDEDEICGSFLMAGTGYGQNWVLFW